MYAVITMTVQVRLLHDVLHEVRKLLDVISHFRDRAIANVLAGALNVVRGRFAPLDLLLHAPADVELQSILQNVVALLAGLERSRREFEQAQRTSVRTSSTSQGVIVDGVVLVVVVVFAGETVVVLHLYWMIVVPPRPAQ